MFESNDTFIEDVVKVKEMPADKRKKVGLSVFTIILLFATIAFTNPLKIAFTILLIVFAILTIIELSNKNIEYEYDYTNGSLEVAKIIDNSRRKSIIQLEPSEVKLVAAVDSNESMQYDHLKPRKFDCSGHNDAKDYILIAHREAKGDDIKLVFTPSERLLVAMAKYNKNEVHK